MPSPLLSPCCRASLRRLQCARPAMADPARLSAPLVPRQPPSSARTATTAPQAAPAATPPAPPAPQAAGSPTPTPLTTCTCPAQPLATVPTLRTTALRVSLHTPALGLCSSLGASLRCQAAACRACTILCASPHSSAPVCLPADFSQTVDGASYLPLTLGSAVADVVSLRGCVDACRSAGTCAAATFAYYVADTTGSGAAETACYLWSPKSNGAAGR